MTAKTRGTRIPYRGRIIDVSIDAVTLPNGHEMELEIVRHPGASAVVPMDENGQVILVRQYRHATEGYLLEIPAGKIDSGEAPEACARREVEEEVGMEPLELIPMGDIWPSPGFTDERIWLYLAPSLRQSAPSLEPDEVLSVERVPLDEAIRMALDGVITDAKSICALLRVPKYLNP